MAAKGMGAATRGGGCVEKTGGRHGMEKRTSQTTGPIMMAKGGYVSPRKKMAMGAKCAHKSQG